MTSNKRGKIIDICLILGIISCFIYLGYWGLQYAKNKFEVTTVQKKYSITDTKTIISPDKDIFEGVPDVSADDKELLTDMQAFKLLSRVNLLTIDHKSLLEQNPDYIGWIQIPDTEVSYPVYKSSDNNDYLHHNAEGEYSYAGCIFMDKDNENMDDYNVIFHGHNMRIGTMFHTLKNYTNVGYYNTHPFIIFYTKDGERKIYRIYSFYSENASKLENTAYKTLFSSTKEKTDFLNDSKDKSMVNTNQNVSESDNILTLSTCTSSGNGRFIVEGYEIDADKALNTLISKK